MSDDDDGGGRRAERLIHEAREEAFAVRKLFTRQAVRGETDPETKRRLAAAAYEYWDVLYEHRDEMVLDEGDFPDIGPIESRLGQRVQMPAASARRGGGHTLRSVPAVNELDDWYLIRVTKQLDDCRKKLGFGATVREKTPHDDIGHDDLAALLDNRGQDEALDKVPGGG